MIQTISAEQDRNLLEAAFYSKPFSFSYSSLNRLLLAPSIFYKEYILKEKEVKTEKYLLAGTLIHFLLLEHQNFDDRFVVVPESLPSDNSVLVAKTVFDIHQNLVKEGEASEDNKLSDYESEILEVLEDINLHQSVKDPAKRAAKIIEPRTEAYFEFLKVKDTRDIIDSDLLEQCQKAVDIIRENDDIMELLGMTREPVPNEFAVYNEIPLTAQLKDMPFGIKGIIDNMTVDVKTKKICINDFKTSGKSIQDFKESVDYWNYWLQCVIYVKLAEEFFKDVIDDSWTIEFRFIVYDKYSHLYAYQVSKDTFKEWNMNFKYKVLSAAKYHYESKEYNLPYEFAVGNVEL